MTGEWKEEEGRRVRGKAEEEESRKSREAMWNRKEIGGGGEGKKIEQGKWRRKR